MPISPFSFDAAPDSGEDNAMTLAEYVDDSKTNWCARFATTMHAKVRGDDSVRA